MSRSPAHPSCPCAVTVVANSSCASYRLAHASAHAPAKVTACPCSARLTRASVRVETRRYTNRDHAVVVWPTLAAPCTLVGPDRIAPHRPASCSRRGRRVSVSTLACAVQRSTEATPYCSIPASTSASGVARSPAPERTSCPSSARLCQKSAEASSRLSKKSSSE